ncbi:unnamed protein product [Bemisia tabaci]|uniref:Cryptochrome-1 n=1 Tax=Bemisia tabaci TaxID=7038 RepID=A0A9P0AK54_BEMTA|nr:unnamed protein product [Bemisia tabaci]
MSEDRSPRVSVLWFRHGLRIHDNPALLRALEDTDIFYPVFIFDGESAGTKLISYNRMKFLLESLEDLDNQFRAKGGKLYVFFGSPIEIFAKFKAHLNFYKLTFEQDCEPIWQARDSSVKKLCDDLDIIWDESISHTLWDPREIIDTNGGSPPLTYSMFLHTVSVIGPPPRPVEDPCWDGIKFGVLPESLKRELDVRDKIPVPADFNLKPELKQSEYTIEWFGGENQALSNLRKRIAVEEKAFRQGFCQPNQTQPDLLGPPTSQSAALRYGCLSVRKFFWALHDTFSDVHNMPSNSNITSQLIWREYFYTMSVDNKYYAEMARNPVCLNIPWSSVKDETAKANLKAWEDGKTGYPFIDALMRQLKQEGWIHHIGRNAVSSFLTRGDLWISWEEGLRHFLRYLLDADWSVCAGNWMWVSSSAFEKLLDCNFCICPVNYGRRLDPYGEFVKRYVPELQKMPVEYVYEPWRAPLEVQEHANCVIGRDYPKRIVDHNVVSHENKEKMKEICKSLKVRTPHCAPSDELEIRQYMWLPDSCTSHLSTLK